MADKKRFKLGSAIVNISTMEQEMAHQVVLVADSCLKECFTEKDMAAAIKAAVTELYPQNIWHVFVGRNFSCYCTHEQDKYIYFYIGQMGIVVFAS